MSAAQNRGVVRVCAIIGVFGLLALSACDVFRDADQRVERADKMIAAHQYREAAIELRNALQNEPAHIQARVRLAEVELQLGDAASAEKDLRRAIEQGASATEHAELMARIDLAFGQARDLLTRIDANEIALTGSARSIYRGRALLDLRMFAPAQTEFEAVEATDPRHASARIGVAEALAGQGKSDLALVELDSLVARDASSFDAWLERGTLHATRGEFAAAAADLQHARELATPAIETTARVRLLASLTEVLLAQGNTKDAAAVHQELVAFAPDTLVTQVLVARIAMANQDYATATASLQRTLAIAPNAMPVRFLLGASLLAQGNLGQAEQQLSQVVQRAPENLEARKLLAQTQLRLQRPEAAIQLLSGMEEGKDPQLDLLLGVAHMQHGEATTGVAHFERAAAARPDDVSLKLDLASAYLRAERPADAVALLSKLDRSKAGVRQTGLLVVALELQGNRRGAQAEVDRLLAQQPRDPATLELAAAFAAQRRDFATARDLSQRAIAANPKSVELLLVRARIEMQAGEAAVAEQWLTKAVELDPGSAAARLGLAQLAVRRGDLTMATRTLEELRKRDASAVDARLQLAGLYLRMRNNEAAKGVVDELATLGEQRPEVLNALGQLYLDNGRYDEALLRFQSATALDSANPVFWLNTARTQITLGNSGVAREALEKAAAAQPGWIPAVGTLAMLDIKEGRAPAAIKRVNELTSSRPRDGDAMTLRGDVQMVLKEFAKAAADYDAAAAIKPSGILAAKAFKARQLGNLPNATAPLEKWLAAHPDDDPLRLLLADAFQRAGERRRAANEYEIVEKRGTASPLILNNLAWLYYELKDARAEPTARRAYEQGRDTPAVADTYGWILVENGKAAEGLPVLKTAAAAGKDPSTEYHYAVALIRTGAAEEGRRRLTELLGRSPSFPEAEEARKLLDSGGAR